MGAVMGVDGLRGDSASPGEQSALSSVVELDDESAGDSTSSSPGSWTPSSSSLLRASSKASAKLLLDTWRGHMPGRWGAERDDMVDSK
jgi:hypothetical protein